jgi:hypothetical protein
MVARKPHRKQRWKRWIIGALAFLLLCVCVGTGWAFYQIYSIDISDIQTRQEARQEGQPAEEAVPSILNDSVQAANQHASKPIETQDALDVAAILLKSGLSLKEIYFLTGQASDQLSTEEKQKIRDLLLAKLTSEEITALRSITQDYGKHLVILDPNYPIELVGVYDETERKRIMTELEAKKQAAGSASGSATAAPIAASAPVQGPSSTPFPTPSPTPIQKGSQVSSSADPAKQAQKSVIENKYNEQITQLKASCDSQVNGFVQEVSEALKQLQGENQQSVVETLQNQFLPKIVKAEQSCDTGFQQLLKAAQEEYQESGYDPKDLNNWQEQYDKYKSEMRSKAFAQIASNASQ